MKRIYLIDYENVRKDGLRGLNSLNQADTVIMFHYEGEGKVKNNVLQELASTKAFTMIQRIKVHSKNAMDFEIVAMLGYMVNKHKNKVEYYIVSKDKGYLAAMECIKNLEPGLKVELIPSIEDSIVKISISDEATLVKNAINKPTNIANKVIRIMKSADSLVELHNSLVKAFDKDGRDFYKAVAPIYKTMGLCGA